MGSHQESDTINPRFLARSAADDTYPDPNGTNTVHNKSSGVDGRPQPLVLSEARHVRHRRSEEYSRARESARFDKSAISEIFGAHMPVEDRPQDLEDDVDLMAISPSDDAHDTT